MDVKSSDSIKELRYFSSEHSSDSFVEIEIFNLLT